MIRERFAPSPTGLLHLGHAFSALTAWDAAGHDPNQFLLRIEDIDGPRCRPEFETQIFDDLTWLGIQWNTPVMRQSERMGAYQSALQNLDRMGLIYPCNCTRKDIETALSARQEGDRSYQVYPGTCHHKTMADFKNGDAIRLNMERAVAQIPQVGYIEIGDGLPKTITTSAEDLVTKTGDIVLARKDIKTSYHLAVVVDDAAQFISHVTRGQDMANQTPIHVLLQHLLGFETPIYRHHRLIRDDQGKRLAKRHDALALKTLRSDGWTPKDIRAHLDFDKIPAG
ncbi:MAG: tRNA glutamyl-Q(34) synthetase GluQRS [Pseudomonadota bacterium]